jgi:uncharacterized protein YoxC
MPLAGVTTIVLGLVAALAIAGCVAVIAMQLWKISTTLATVDATLAQLPSALAGLEPAVDTINESLARVADVTTTPVGART